MPPHCKTKNRKENVFYPAMWVDISEQRERERREKKKIVNKNKNK